MRLGGTGGECSEGGKSASFGDVVNFTYAPDEKPSDFGGVSTHGAKATVIGTGGTAVATEVPAKPVQHVAVPKIIYASRTHSQLKQVINDTKHAAPPCRATQR